MDIQPVADVENEDRSQRGKDDAGRMKAFVGRARKHMSDGAANDRANDSEHDRPEDRHVNVHDRLRDHTRKQTDQDIPD